jgi:hypothetical protein
MARPQFYNEIQTNVPGLKIIYASGTGAGAAALTSVKGVASIAETATGKYTVTLNHKVKQLLWVQGIVVDPTTVDDWQVTVETDLTTNNAFGILVTKSGTATDLTTDEKLLLVIHVQDSATLPAGR